MDIKQYISSGILENYVLGFLSANERAEVEANLLKYPEIRKELDSIELTFETLAESNKVKAPPGLEKIILEKINTEANSNSSDSYPSKKSSKSNLGDYLLGFLVLATALIAGWGIIQYQKQQGKLKEAKTQFEILEKDCKEKDTTLKSLRDQLLILRESDQVKIPMKGTDKAPTAIANVLYNEKTQKSYLDVLSLPMPPTDKQYQLWAIVDGTPVDMGVFDLILAGNTLQEVPFIENPQAFAVTLENRGGSPTPTLEEMVVIGNFVSS